MCQKIHESPFQMLKALLRGTRFIPGMSIEQYINRFWVTNVRVAVQTLQRRQENAGWKSPENGAEKILKMGRGKSWKWGWKILKMVRRNPENGMEKWKILFFSPGGWCPPGAISSFYRIVIGGRLTGGGGEDPRWRPWWERDRERHVVL